MFISLRQCAEPLKLPINIKIWYTPSKSSVMPFSLEQNVTHEWPSTWGWVIAVLQTALLSFVDSITLTLLEIPTCSPFWTHVYNWSIYRFNRLSCLFGWQVLYYYTWLGVTKQQVSMIIKNTTLTHCRPTQATLRKSH